MRTHFLPFFSNSSFSSLDVEVAAKVYIFCTVEIRYIILLVVFIA